MTDADGWIEHDGKGMPVDVDTMVMVRFRDGTQSSSTLLASAWDWGEDGIGTITHYRVVGEAGHATVGAKAPDSAPTLRDQFAIAAVPYFLDTLPALPEGTPPDMLGAVVAKHVYAFADAMLAQRDKK